MEREKREDGMTRTMGHFHSFDYAMKYRNSAFAPHYDELHEKNCSHTNDDYYSHYDDCDDYSRGKETKMMTDHSS